MNTVEIYQGDNLNILKSLPDKTFSLCYTDPPFNTGVAQKRKRTTKGKFQADISKLSYHDKFDNFITWIKPRIEEIYRVLKDNGSFFIHMDYREIHYVKVLCDEIFGRDCFINEIIWSYDFGARSKNRWSAKHDTILWYVKNRKKYTFNFNEVDRVPYKAPQLIRQTAKNAEEKIARGKTITDVWTDNIVHTMSKERTGYPTQKPIVIAERIVKVHSNKDDKLLDPFSGSGTFGEAAIRHGRNVVLVDENPDAVNVMKKRFSAYDTVSVQTLSV